MPFFFLGGATVVGWQPEADYSWCVRVRHVPLLSFALAPLAQADLFALAESLAMGLDTGATMGEVIVAETMDASATAVIPTAVEPTEHTAAIITRYTGAPEVGETGLVPFFLLVVFWCFFLDYGTNLRLSAAPAVSTICRCWPHRTPEMSLNYTHSYQRQRTSSTS